MFALFQERDVSGCRMIHDENEYDISIVAPMQEKLCFLSNSGQPMGGYHDPSRKLEKNKS